MEEEMIDMMDQLEEETPTKEVKCFLLKNHHWMISTIEEIPAELGNPNCKLTKPFVIDQVYEYDSDYGQDEWQERPLVKVGKSGYSMKYEIYPWKDFTNDDEILLFSDFIVTIVEPRPELLEAYLEATE